MAGEAVQEWRTGWRYVLMTHVGILGSIFMTFGLGQFIRPLSEAFGWSRAQITAPTLLYSIGTILFATALGALVDRQGARRVALVGVPLTGLAIAAAGLAGPSITVWYAAWAAYAVVGLALGPITWSAAVMRHFDRSRGLALALGYSASGVGGALWPPLSLWLIETYGWRNAFFAIGLGIALVVTPTAWLIFRGAVVGPRAAVAAHSGAPLRGLTLRQALGSSIFWRVSLAMMVSAAAAASTAVHLPAMMTDKGVSPLQAAAIASAIGPALIVGRVACGWLLDFASARTVACGFFTLAVVGCGLLIGYDGDRLRGLAAAVLIGLTMGAEGDLLAYFISRYCGMRSFSAIYGVGLAIFGIGYGGAPFASGLLFDRLADYDIGYMVLTGLLVAAVGLALSFGRYPDHDAAAEATGAT